ncbi:MAG: ABC transporter permease, partial [Thermoplasmatota archaeon]
MRLFDMVRLAFNSLTHRKLRTSLAILGIVIGVVSVVALLSIGQGFQNNITSRLGGLGTNQITIVPGHSRAGPGFRFAGDQAASTQATNLTTTDVRAVRSTPGVDLVDSVVSGRATVAFRSQKANLNIQGVDTATWAQIQTSQLQAGRLLQSGDANVAVVGANLALDLFTPPVGLDQLITIGGQNVQVVGILQASGGFGGGGDSAVYVPQPLARQILNTPVTVVDSIVAKVPLDANISAVSDLITARLLSTHQVTAAKQDFTVETPGQFQSNVQQIQQSITIFLA